jgi:hypothetical protein
MVSQRHNGLDGVLADDIAHLLLASCFSSFRPWKTIQILVYLKHNLDIAGPHLWHRRPQIGYPNLVT